MCSDHVDFMDSREQSSRKWRWCDECRGLIAPGDRYVHIRSVYDGSWSTLDLHAGCDSIATHAAKLFGDEGCRLLDSHSSSQAIDGWGTMYHDATFKRASRVVTAALSFMRVRSKLRYAKALAQAWGAA